MVALYKFGGCLMLYTDSYSVPSAIQSLLTITGPWKHFYRHMWSWFSLSPAIQPHFKSCELSFLFLSIGSTNDAKHAEYCTVYVLLMFFSISSGIRGYLFRHLRYRNHAFIDNYTPDLWWFLLLQMTMIHLSFPSKNISLFSVRENRNVWIWTIFGWTTRFVICRLHQKSRSTFHFTINCILMDYPLSMPLSTNKCNPSCQLTVNTNVIDSTKYLDCIIHPFISFR